MRQEVVETVQRSRLKAAHTLSSGDLRDKGTDYKRVARLV